MRQIAFYGKGGVGKSTVVSNVAACLALAGRQVLQLGCDPKCDSTRSHLGGRAPRSVLDRIRELGSSRELVRRVRAEELRLVGSSGVHCIEAGGPEPGVGCAGRGIVVTIEALTALGVFESPYDAILYDVLGDVVCGGFAMPIRHSYAEDVYLVVSGEFLSLYAANNICRGIRRYARSGATRLAGVVGNLRGTPGEEAVISAFAKGLGTEVAQFIPHSPLILAAERQRRTVVELEPDAEITRRFRALAEALLSNPSGVVPALLEDAAVERIVIDGHLSATREDR